MSEKTGMRKNCPRQLPAIARLTASPLHFSNQLLMMEPKMGTVVPPNPAAASTP